jgi:hypothetical protein
MLIFYPAAAGSGSALKGAISWLFLLCDILKNFVWMIISIFVFWWPQSEPDPLLKVGSHGSVRGVTFKFFKEVKMLICFTAVAGVGSASESAISWLCLWLEKNFVNTFVERWFLCLFDGHGRSRIRIQERSLGYGSGSAPALMALFLTWHLKFFGKR